MAKSPGGINPPARGTANWHWGAHLGTQRDASPLDKRLGGAFLIRTDHRLQGLPGSTLFFPCLRSQSSSGRRRPVYKIHDDLTEMLSPNFEHYQQHTKKSRDSGHHRLADPWCEYLRPQGPHRWRQKNDKDKWALHLRSLHQLGPKYQFLAAHVKNLYWY